MTMMKTTTMTGIKDYYYMVTIESHEGTRVVPSSLL